MQHDDKRVWIAHDQNRQEGSLKGSTMLSAQKVEGPYASDIALVYMEVASFMNTIEVILPKNIASLQDMFVLKLESRRWQRRDRRWTRRTRHGDEAPPKAPRAQSGTRSRAI